MSGQRLTFLITSGSTKEYIDPVRYISNDSSGKMGAALAGQALIKKHKVIFICGKSDVLPPDNINLIRVISAADMFKSVKKYFNSADIIIGAAAVADFTPVSCNRHKIKKGTDVPVIKLKKTPDIIAYCGKNKKNKVVAGFALETENLYANAVKKLQSKKLDIIIANGKESMGADTASVCLINREGESVSLKNAGKNKIAGKIINETIRIFKNNKTGKKIS
jgi:Phosphopantothenoylcysteine synthetase/decarboxylase